MAKSRILPGNRERPGLQARFARGANTASNAQRGIDETTDLCAGYARFAFRNGSEYSSVLGYRSSSTALWGFCDAADRCAAGQCFVRGFVRRRGTSPARSERHSPTGLDSNYDDRRCQFPAIRDMQRDWAEAYPDWISRADCGWVHPCARKRRAKRSAAGRAVSGRHGRRQAMAAGPKDRRSQGLGRSGGAR